MTTTAAHTIRWFVVVEGQRFPRTATMRGTYGYDATCSCGWDSKVGGGVRSYIQQLVADHKTDVQFEADLLAEMARTGEDRQQIVNRKYNEAFLPRP